MSRDAKAGDLNLRTRPEPHNTQYLEAMASYWFVRERVTGMNVLDAGCAFGYGTDLLGNFAARVTGVDFSAPTISWAKNRYRRSNISFIRADLHDPVLPLGLFDAVCLFEVIHLVRDPRAVLRNLAAAVKKNGVLFLTTRNWKENADRHPDRVHLHCLTRPQWESVLSECGFKVEEAYGISRPQHVYRIEKELDGLRRFDTCGLRRLIPRGIVSLGVALAARIKGIQPPQELKPQDFKIGPDELETGPGLFFSCRRV
jgi:SAM-dependent methyltransferase